MLDYQTNGLYQFINSAGHINTRGTETNIKIGYEDFKLFLGYTFTNTRLHQNGILTNTPLTPKHGKPDLTPFIQEQLPILFSGTFTHRLMDF